MSEAKEFIVRLNKVFRAPRQKRANRAINFIKKFMRKHFKIKVEDVIISNKVNEFIWANGREHIPRKIKLKAVKDEQKVKVYLEQEIIPKKEKKKGKKQEKKEEKTKPKQEKAKEKTKEGAKEALDQKRKLDEKRAMEKAAEKAAIKRKTK